MGSDIFITEYGPLSKSLKVNQLSNLSEPKTGIQTGPFGSQLHKKDYVENGTPIITVEHLGENRISHIDTPFVSDDDKERLKKYSLKEGDIVFSRVGSVDRRALVRKDEDGWLFSGRCLRVRADKEQLDPKYLSYFFGFEGFKQYIRGIAVGATMPSINTKILSDIRIFYPEKKQQKAIAHILGSLDDKIELNRQMNETLESMAQALFKSWFVDFDPVIDNALAAGNPIPDVFAERAEQRRELNANAEKTSISGGVSFNASENSHQSLFPSEFEFTEEMGWIPKGWGIKKISDLVNTISETFPLKTVDKVVFLNTGDIQEGRFLHQNYFDSQGLPGQAKKSIKENDILYSEIRPKNKRYAYVNFDTADYVVSTKLMVLRSTGEVKSLFTYFVLTQDDKVEYLQTMAESRSGTFPQITFDVLSKISLALPKKPELIDQLYAGSFRTKLQ